MTGVREDGQREGAGGAAHGGAAVGRGVRAGAQVPRGGGRGPLQARPVAGRERPVRGGAARLQRGRPQARGDARARGADPQRCGREPLR